jgi:hypothetical protein
VKAVRLTNEQVERIVATDEAAGDSLQTSPLAWQHRRELLGHVIALEDAAHSNHLLTLELSTLLEPISGGAMTLSEIVARIRASQTLHAEVQEAMLQRQRDDARVNQAFHPQSVVGDILDRDAAQRKETGHPMLCGCEECM